MSATDMREAHRRFERTLKGLSDRELCAKAIEGTWCARDIAAHLIAWNDEIILAAEALLAGRRVSHHPIKDGEAFNAAAAVKHRHRSWSDVKRELDGTIARGEKLIGKLTPEQLAMPASYPWGSSGTLDGLLRGINEHQDEHSHHLEGTDPG